MSLGSLDPNQYDEDFLLDSNSKGENDSQEIFP